MHNFKYNKLNDFVNSPIAQPAKIAYDFIVYARKGKYKKRSYYGITKVHQTKTVQHDENLY